MASYTPQQGYPVDGAKFNSLLTKLTFYIFLPIVFSCFDNIKNIKTIYYLLIQTTNLCLNLPVMHLSYYLCSITQSIS
jgi:hypothetical protein